METPSPAAKKITRKRPVRACMRCRTRRVQCDRAEPACATCARAQAPCTYASPPGNPAPAVTGGPLTESRRRLHSLEQTVQRLARQLEQRRDKPAAAAPAAAPAVPDDGGGPAGGRRSPSSRGAGTCRAGTGIIVPGPRSQYFGPESWAAITEELADIERLLSAEEHDSTEHCMPPGEKAAPLNYVTATLLADEADVRRQVDLFMELIHPVIPIIHKPGFLRQLDEYFRLRVHFYDSSCSMSPVRPQSGASGDPTMLYGTGHGHKPSGNNGSRNGAPPRRYNHKAFEAFLLAVLSAVNFAVARSKHPYYYATEEELLKGDLKTLRDAAEQALEDADFIRNGTLETLQAMVLLIATTPRVPDPRTPWIKLGLAIRHAQSMGFHRDGALYKLGPVETEVRRRVWAQICLLDVRAAEETGCEPTILDGSYDTCLPLSITDERLEQWDRGFRSGDKQSFDSRDYTTEPHGPGSPAFAIFRYRVARVLQRIMSPRYRPADCNLRLSRAQDASLPSYAAGWVEEMERTLRRDYDGEHMDMGDAGRRTVVLTVELLIIKVRFITSLQLFRRRGSRLTDEGANADARPDADAETAGRHSAEVGALFEQATRVMELSWALVDEAHRIRTGWYSHTFREYYAPTFLLFMLSRRGSRGLPAAAKVRAWAAIDRMFPADLRARGARGLQPLVHRLFLEAEAARARERGGTAAVVDGDVDGDVDVDVDGPAVAEVERLLNRRGGEGAAVADGAAGTSSLPSWDDVNSMMQQHEAIFYPFSGMMHDVFSF